MILGYSCYNQKLAFAGIYGIYELIWEFWEDAPVQVLRRRLLFGNKNDKNINKEQESRTKDSVLSKYDDEDFSKIANFLTYSPQ